MLEFLLIGHAHLTTHNHTNSSTHIFDILSIDAKLTFTLSAHLMAKTSLICFFQ